MAVAARPGTSDARVPCPLCGGLIHPIAGRCKHCKADLTGYHSARPAASTPLPALHANHAAASTSPVAPMVAAAREGAQPVLPPRPPARAYPVEPKSAAWRSWPVLVIVVALLAIAGALAAMAWPASARPDGKGGKRSLPPPPAPERMQTDPQIKPPSTPPVPRRSAQADGAPSPAQPDPWAANEPDDSDDGGHDLDATDDALGAPSPTGNLGPAAHAIRSAMMSRVCTKLARCGGSDDSGVQGMCDALAAQAIEPPACPAAIRCLARIDSLPCGVQSDLLRHIQMVVIRLPDCAEAARC